MIWKQIQSGLHTIKNRKCKIKNEKCKFKEATTNTNVTDLASRGNLVFNITPLRGLHGLLTAKSTFGGEVELLKPPGNEGNLSFSTNSMYGISNRSPHKEMASEFLKFLVSDEMMSQRTLMGMPLNKTVFPQLARRNRDVAKG